MSCSQTLQWDAQLNGCPGFHVQKMVPLHPWSGDHRLHPPEQAIDLWKAHGRGSSWCGCLETKDANHVNTTWPSGWQEEIKISDALSGGCQIEQLKESLHLHMGNKVLENETTHTHMQTKPQVLNVHSVFHIVPHLVDLAFFFTRLVTSP